MRARRLSHSFVLVVAFGLSVVAPASLWAADTDAGKPTPTPPAVDAKLAITEQRSSVNQVMQLRKSAADKGDKVKESCLYERLRGLSQTLDSTLVAVAALEAAGARGDQKSERAERELVTGSRATSISVSGGGQGDDAKAGPAELQTIRPVRLELPSRPNPASAFRPAR